MKKLCLLFTLLLMLTSCAATYKTTRTVKEMDEIALVLSEYYPQLYTYYIEGVLEVASVKEVVVEDGSPAYNVKYRFINYYYHNQTEMMEILKNEFPELYQMYVNGVIEVTGMYKYVEKDTGVIRNHVSYRRIYDFYYERTIIPYNHTRLYYRPRPMPLPRYQPAPPPPRQNPGPRPGGNNRSGGNPGPRGGRR